jgi:hypothetical protein
MIATSNLIYLDHAVVTWEHFVTAAFSTLSHSLSGPTGTSGANRNHIKTMRDELIAKLKLVKDDLDARPDNYQDLLAVTFESKARLVLSILKVKFSNFKI